jgi:hypothetical protein
MAIKGKMTKRYSMFTFVLFLATIQVIDPALEQSNIQKDISTYLPRAGEIEEWQPVGSPRKFVGEDLYDLINGGAAIFYEYGFKQVITQEFVNENGGSINLEIYEMANAASAYGIYSFRMNGDGEEIGVGTDAMLEDYYLTFWKGNFLVTLTAYDSDQETLNGLLAIAEAVGAKIKEKGQKPRLVNMLPGENLKRSTVKYVKGNLALSNNYEFNAGDIFGLKEGVIGDYDQYKVFIFKYNNEDECMKWFRNAYEHLKDSPGFDGFAVHEYDFSMTDRAGNYVYAKKDLNYILIFVGTRNLDPKKILEELIDKAP